MSSVGPRARDSSGKEGSNSPKLRVGSWNIRSPLGKSTELVKILKNRKISVACV